MQTHYVSYAGHRVNGPACGTASSVCWSFNDVQLHRFSRSANVADELHQRCTPPHLKATTTFSEVNLKLFLERNLRSVLRGHFAENLVFMGS